MKVVQQGSQVFLFLLILTGFFFLLEFSFFIQCIHYYFADFTFVAERLHIPASIAPGVIGFILAQLLIHLLYAFLLALIIFFIKKTVPLSQRYETSLVINVWVLFTLTLLVANHCLLPNSKFSALTSLFLINEKVSRIVFITLLLLCSNVLLIAFIGLISEMKSFFKHRKNRYYLSLIGLIFFLSGGWQLVKPADFSAATDKKPNVIIVGIDSLRPDFLSFNGHGLATPFFDSFLDQATVFNEAITPLARTFPSWISILSGQYPKMNGVRFNLANPLGMNFNDMLPKILQKAGYTTYYASDETRFSNIDKQMGFDHIITPPIGLNDFLLGTFNDFPLSNLLINTVVGQWLFPHSYANRPVFFTYDPGSFLKMIFPWIHQTHKKPLFLSVHFCLAHYPYLWKDASGIRYDSIVERYMMSVQRVDKQLKDFFNLLTENHLLDHAILVLLSDHGEALGLLGDRITEKEGFVSDQQHKMPLFYPPTLDNEAVNQSAGHGTDVLGLSQYHTLLAFKLYGTGNQSPGGRSGIVSLLDIKPTLLELLGLKPRTEAEKWQGHSLVAQLSTAHATSKKEHLFLESDFSPAAIRTVYPEIQQAVLEGIELFQIDPVTTRLIVKPTMGYKIIRSKQLADIYGEWMLALYPQNLAEQMPILINLTTGQWTNDLNSTLAAQAPIKQMQVALKSFYGDEIHL